MLKQRQTIFGAKTGNCFATCVASLLDISIEEGVPNFCFNGSENWFADADEWLKARGFRLIEVTGATGIVMLPGALFVAGGKSPRGDFLHCVIVTVDDEGHFRVAMDPHPSDDGLAGPFLSMTMLVKA